MTTASQQVLTSDRPAPQPATKALAPVQKQAVPVMLAPLLAGVLHWLCYFPVNGGWLAWVALVPLLTLVRSPARPRTIFLAASLGGLAFYLPALHWFWYPENKIMAVLGTALAVYCALYWPVAIHLLRRLDAGTRLPLCVTVPVVWTALEFLRAHLLTGFPWYFLGHSQHEFLALIQISDLAGAYAVTFLVAAVNVVIFEWLNTCGWVQHRWALPDRPGAGLKRQTIIVMACLGAVVVYGYCRISQEDFASGPRLALIQGNVPQRVRNQASTTDADREELAGGMLRHYLELTDQALRQQPDLLVWPETSFPDEWWDLTADFAARDLSGLGSGVPWDSVTHGEWRPVATLMLNREILGPLRRWPIDILIGIGCRVQRDGDRDHGTRFNSAVLLRLGQDRPSVARYDKIHRVPFGEYLPLRDWLPFIKVFSPYDTEYGIQSGESYTRFALGNYHFGALICFEDTDPYLARQYVRPSNDGAPPVDFLVNISNDGWFGGSSEHDQHLAICRFRAIECRRAVARSVNMGISAMIDGSGRVVALPADDWKSSKSIAAVVTANVPLDRRDSVYACWGDWLPTMCWLVLGVGLAWSIARPRSDPVKAGA